VEDAIFKRCPYAAVLGLLTRTGIVD